MGSQNAIIATNLPSFPWAPRDKLDAVPLNNAFLGLQNQITSLSNAIALLQVGLGGGLTEATLNWGGNSIITSGPYVLIGTAPYSFTIKSIDTNVGTNGGSFVADFFIDDVIFATILVTSAQKSNTAIIAGDITKGSMLSMSIRDVVNFPTNSWICINSLISQNVVIEPITSNVGQGHAFGQGIAIGRGAFIMDGQGIAFASGDSVVTATSAIIARAVGSASGSSVADGRITSSSLQPFLALDDPSEGGLDVNPLE